MMTTTVRVDNDVAREFKRAVEDKHGSRYGNVLTETNAALEFWTKVLRGEVDLPRIP